MLAAGTGLVPGLSEASRLDRPMLLGSAGLSMSSPTSAALPERTRPAGLPSTLAERARRNPYGRLALNGPFATLWTGGLFSLFGDRVNQVVLGFFVLRETGSFIAVSFVFFAATVPNLVFGSLAGTFVDRANQKRVMVLSDFIRAGLVFMLPIAAAVSTVFVYPLVFMVTSVSIFFRPAREAVIPRIVPADELMAANSATWMSETLADIVGYALAGLLLLVLGSEFTLAFWFDAVTYVVSGTLIATIAIPLVVHRVSLAERTFRSDFLEGWRFLRHDAVLFANTLQGIVGQMAIGALLPLSVIYANDVINGGSLPGTTVYAFLEGAIGVGNLIGGVVVGLIGMRIGKGRLVIAGYTVARRLHPRVQPDRRLAPGHRPDGRGRHGKSVLRDPEPDHVPAARAARHDGPGRVDPLLAGPRHDDPGDRCQWAARDGVRRLQRDRLLRDPDLPGGTCRLVQAGSTRRVMATSVHWRPRRACADRSTTAE